MASPDKTPLELAKLYAALLRLGYEPRFDCSAHLYGLQSAGPFWMKRG